MGDVGLPGLYRSRNGLKDIIRQVLKEEGYNNKKQEHPASTGEILKVSGLSYSGATIGKNDTRFGVDLVGYSIAPKKSYFKKLVFYKAIAELAFLAEAEEDSDKKSQNKPEAAGFILKLPDFASYGRKPHDDIKIHTWDTVAPVYEYFDLYDGPLYIYDKDLKHITKSGINITNNTIQHSNYKEERWTYSWIDRTQVLMEKAAYDADGYGIRFISNIKPAVMEWLINENKIKVTKNGLSYAWGIITLTL